VREDFTRELNQPLTGLRIGVPKEYFGEGLAADVEQAVRAALAKFVNWARPWSISRCRTPRCRSRSTT
jgi:Asp-tRNA(Asn)/Glu-tRNA(Gln) amidotransferase A subunit family amidase